MPNENPTYPSVTRPFRHPLCYWDIYVDNFCGLVQGDQWTRRMVKQILFQALDKVFRPVDAGDTKYRQEPASLKKLQKGDTRWTTVKKFLAGCPIASAKIYHFQITVWIVSTKF